MNEDAYENVDKSTGEVFDNKAKKGEQLLLFEGHRIDLIEQRLKAANLGTIGIHELKDIPKYKETRYFVVKAVAKKIQHSEDKDGLTVKTVKYEVDGSRQIDEFSAQRLLMGM